jgi:hypothetical protein
VPGFVYTVTSGRINAVAAAPHEEMLEGDSPFWSNVREQKFGGLVLAPAGLAFKAMRYGHLPIALDAAAYDFINYLPQTAMAFGRLVERGYGVSFFNPPASVRLFVGSLPRTTGRRYWACLSPQQWKQIAHELGIVALLAPADWVVRLPRQLSDRNYALYAMPGELSPQGQTPEMAVEPSCPLDHE